MSDAPRETVDVRHLPEAVSGPRAVIWWGVALMITIEATMFALATAAYFYIRGNERVWPPSAPGARAAWFASGAAAALALSLGPMYLASRAAVRGSLRGMRAGVGGGLLLGAAFLALRYLELKSLTFRWDQHAYGSIVWVSLGIHTAHGVASFLENAVFLALLFRGPIEKKGLTDVQTNSLYWYFVVASGLPLWAVFYVEWLVVPR